MNKGKVFKDGDIKIIDLRDLNFTTDTPDDAILTSKAKDIKDLIVRVKELESSNNKLKNGIKVLDEIIRDYIGSKEELKAKVKELTKLQSHNNGKVLLGWMDAHRKAMDKVERLEADAMLERARSVGDTDLARRAFHLLHQEEMEGYFGDKAKLMMDLKMRFMKEAGE